MRPRDLRSHAPPRAVVWTGALWVAALGQVRAAPPPRVVPQVVPSARDASGPPLESLGDGRLRHRGDGFTAIVHPDGSVEFRDRRGQLDASFLGFDLRARTMKKPRDERAPSDAAFADRAIFPMGQVPIFGGIGGSFGGLADWTLKERHGGAKRAFLEATSELRLGLAYAWQRERLEEQLAGLGARLVKIWRDPTLPLAERKRRLFALWDECEEESEAPAEPLDALRQAGGAAARAKIEAYILKVAPEGSAQSFTPRDLEVFNKRRRSRGRFDPYAEGAGVRRELPVFERPAQERRAVEATVRPDGPEPPPAAPR